MYSGPFGEICQPLRRRGIVTIIASDLHHNFIPLVHEVRWRPVCIVLALLFVITADKHQSCIVVQ